VETGGTAWRVSGSGQSLGLGLFLGLRLFLGLASFDQMILQPLFSSSNTFPKSLEKKKDLFKKNGDFFLKKLAIF
jgi:hypothetical protein